MLRVGEPNRSRPGVQHLGDDVAGVGTPQVVQLGLHPRVRETLGDGPGQQSGAVPHGVVNHQGFGCHGARGPALVSLQYPGDVLPVDEAVVRGDDLEGEAQLGDLGEELGDQGAEGHEDVGVVLLQLPGIVAEGRLGSPSSKCSLDARWAPKPSLENRICSSLR